MAACLLLVAVALVLLSRTQPARAAVANDLFAQKLGGSSALAPLYAQIPRPRHSCPRTGEATIQVGHHRFKVPRIILRNVVGANGQYDRTWMCSDEVVEAQSFYISVSRDRGRALSHSWIAERKLPPQIEIVRRGRIAKFTSQILNRFGLQQPPLRDAAGFETFITKPYKFFDASPLDWFGYEGHGIVFMCLHATLPHGGNICRVSYPYDDILDVEYGFSSGDFPRSDWIQLDSRFRDFLNGLMQR
jgi:hypothetical protein